MYLLSLSDVTGVLYTHGILQINTGKVDIADIDYELKTAAFMKIKCC